MERLERLRFQLKNQVVSRKAVYNLGHVGSKTEDDVVICSYARTPMTKGKRGAFKDTPPEVMLSAVFKAVVERAKVDPKLIQDIAVGNTMHHTTAQSTGRLAQFIAGIPITSTLYYVNRQCSSGLQACITVAESIIAGRIDCGIGAGVESMSMGNKKQMPFGPDALWEEIFENKSARDCLIPMGITSESVAEEFGITREQQDELSAASHANAAFAQENGYFDEEIVPVKTKVTDKDGNEKEIVVSKDEGIRKSTNMKILSKLRPAFKKGGSTTAGNSSQVSDGAAAVVLARRSFAEKHNLPIVGRLVASAIAGVPPHIMGIGPAYSIPMALQKCGLNLQDIDIVELNEAFASQATYCANKLGIERKRLNPKGGAIALGHPLGMTGARMVGTLMSELKRTKKRFGIVSMCIGTGMGAAAVFEREDGSTSPSYQSYESVNPQTNTLNKKFSFDTKEQILNKINRSYDSYQNWRKISVEERCKKLVKFGQLLQEKSDELAALVTSQMGKPTAQAMFEIDFAAQGIQKAAEDAAAALKPEVVSTNMKKAMVVYQPLGPLYSIQPWNFPISTLVHTNLQSLMAGNTVLLKPAPSCPQTALYIEKLFEQAGMNNGEFIVVLADTADSDLIIGHSKVRGVNFTGSTAAGKVVASICGKYMKKAAFELGGSDPFIILDDADLKQAITAGVMSRFMNAGQCCISAKRFIVQKKIYPAFKSALLGALQAFKAGDPTKPQTQLGPMARAHLRQVLKDQVRETVAAGAQMIYGNQEQLAPGLPKSGCANCFEPVVLEGITPSNPGYSMEFFGPVISLYPFQQDQDAIKLANSIPYGLGGAVFSQNEGRAQNVALELETGNVQINGMFVPQFEMPFGGTKDSGHGRQGGVHGFREFTNIKSILIQ